VPQKAATSLDRYGRVDEVAALVAGRMPEPRAGAFPGPAHRGRRQREPAPAGHEGEDSFCGDEIGRFEPLGEAAVDRRGRDLDRCPPLITLICRISGIWSPLGQRR